MIKFILDNKEWLFSGIGVAFLVWIFAFILKKKKKSSNLITVTIVGGAWDGPGNNMPITINKNDIVSLVDPYNGELGTTVIVMRDKTRYYVIETKNEIERMTR